MAATLSPPPRRAFWRRLLAGGLVVLLATAAGVAFTVFHELHKFGGYFPRPSIPAPVARTAPGKPQTLLLLGSDSRGRGLRGGGGARSDTIMLARLDPKRKSVSLLSLPRDLRVHIPAHGVGKLNAAYELGGPALTVRTVHAVTGIAINHVVNVDFEGFKRAIDAIGCVYADIDRRYFNDSAAYAAIDIQPGYQRLCGQKALAFARFRHEDTDLIRGARQQDVLQAVKQQVGVANLLGNRKRLVHIAGLYTTSDKELKSTKGLLRLIEVAAFSVGQPVRQIQFQGHVGITSGDAGTGIPSYVTATPGTMRALRRQFLGAGSRSATPRGRRGTRKAPGLQRTPVAGKQAAVQAIAAGAGGRLPVYYPTALTAGATFQGRTRYYRIRTPSGRIERSYRMVIGQGSLGEYYGVQGTTWRTPPLLAGPSKTRVIGRRRFQVHYDGGHAKLVAWRTPKAVYWISNTLTQSLSNAQMIAIARSTRLP